MIRLPRLFSLAALFSLSVTALHADHHLSIHFEGKSGPGKGKHVVLVSGDEEYRSEEALPMLAKVLSEHHGFDTTVLFSVNDEGEIDPNNQMSVTNPEAFDSADLIVMALRFRKWPDEAMKHFEDAYLRGVPIVGLRTSTHAFRFGGDSSYRSYNNFGRNVLGENWVSHWGRHKQEGCRGVIEEANEDHPILKGVTDVFADSDVYEAHPPEDVTILMRGAVTESLDPKSKPIEGKKNDPMMPVAWVRNHENPKGKTNRVFCTTMGAATDFESEGLRRLVVNAVYWGLGMEDKISADRKVSPVGDYDPTFYSFNGFKKGMKPADYK